MKRKTLLLAHTITITSLLLAAGCAGTPGRNPLLAEAEIAFEEAENDTLVVQQAPVELRKAEEELEKAQQLWESKGNKERELVEHYAYIADQKVAIARQTALLNAAQDEVLRAEAERQRVLLKARSTEAAAAEHRAQEALEKARQERLAAVQARKEAEELRARAAELSRRISELEAKQTERGLVLTLGDVLFDFDSANLRPGGFRAIEELASFLNEYPERNILIEGFTDSIGSEQYNLNLSHRRAKAVRNALADQGIGSNRIRIRGYGEQYPVASNSTEAGRQQNRRVEVIISDREGYIPERGGVGSSSWR